MKTYHVKRTPEPVSMGGDPVHHLWEHAEPIVLVDCVTGREPKLSTQCRLLWDDSFLYAGYLVQDEKVIATYSKRDEPLYEEDVVELFLAPAGSLNYYYEFNFSPRNVLLDAVVFNDGGQAGVGRGNLNTMTEWNCEDIHWSARIQPDQNWAVTAAIPFTSLHFAENHPPKPGDTWRINVCRIEYGLPEAEYTAWSPPEILDFHTTEKFGQLIFDPE